MDARILGGFRVLEFWVCQALIFAWASPAWKRGEAQGLRVLCRHLNQARYSSWSLFDV